MQWLVFACHRIHSNAHVIFHCGRLRQQPKGVVVRPKAFGQGGESRMFFFWEGPTLRRCGVRTCPERVVPPLCQLMRILPGSSQNRTVQWQLENVAAPTQSNTHSLPGNEVPPKAGAGGMVPPKFARLGTNHLCAMLGQRINDGSFGRMTEL